MAIQLILVLAAVATLFGTFIAALAHAQWATRGLDVVRHLSKP
jgi:hypothetical protein